MLFQEMYTRGQYRPVGIVKGGMHNVFANYLERTGRVMTVSEFCNTPVGEFPERFIYHPGVAQDGKRRKVVFNNQIGFGNFEKWIGRFRDSAAVRKVHTMVKPWESRFLRMIPAKIRRGKMIDFYSVARNIGEADLWGSRILAAILATIQQGNMVDVYSVSRHIGEADAFPHQDQFGQTVTHAQTFGSRLQQINGILISRDSSRINMIPPRENLLIEQEDIFWRKVHSGEIWVDGTTMGKSGDVLIDGDIVIQRAHIGIPVVALVP